VKTNIFAVVGLATLAGCTTASPEEAAKLSARIPPNYRAQIVDKVHGYLNDPFSVKEAEITKPTAVYGGAGQRFPGVCLRFFAKNQFGAYMGRTTFATTFRNGKLYQLYNPDISAADCASPWQSFPELNGKG